MIFKMVDFPEPLVPIIFSRQSESLLHPVGRLIIELIYLRYVLCSYGYLFCLVCISLCHLLSYNTSAKCGFSLLKIRHPIPNSTTVNIQKYMVE